MGWSDDDHDRITYLWCHLLQSDDVDESRMNLFSGGYAISLTLCLYKQMLTQKKRQKATTNQNTFN